MRLISSAHTLRAASRTLLAAGLIAGAASAHAGLILRFDDGVSQLDIADGSALDANSLEGSITYLGSFGTFNLNVSTGTSKPLIGSATEPRLDLNSVNLSGTAGSLSILLTDTDFLGPVGDIGVSSYIGGATDGTVDFSTYLDDSNTAFGMDSLLTDLTLTGNPFSGSEFASLSADGPYSLTIATTINHEGGTSITSFNAGVAVPEPGSLALLFSGLVALVLVRRRARS
jgi:hypothetical protein